MGASQLGGNVMGPVTVRVRNVFFVGLVFEVLGEGDGIEAIAYSLVYPNVWPNATIREDGVHMKVGHQGQVFVCIGEVDSPLIVVIMTVTVWLGE
jgi:hypothetical protein